MAETHIFRVELTEAEIKSINADLIKWDAPYHDLRDADRDQKVSLIKRGAYDKWYRRQYQKRRNEDAKVAKEEFKRLKAIAISKGIDLSELGLSFEPDDSVSTPSSDDLWIGDPEQD